MHFSPGAIPHAEDKEGRKAYKAAILAEIKKLGGKPKASLGLDKLRQLYAQLKAAK